MKSNIRNSILPTAALCGLAIAAGIVTGALTAGFGRILPVSYTHLTLPTN